MESFFSSPCFWILVSSTRSWNNLMQRQINRREEENIPYFSMVQAAFIEYQHMIHFKTLLRLLNDNFINFGTSSLSVIKKFDFSSPGDVDKAMGPLLDKTTPVPIKFEEMVHLMNQCVQLEQMNRRYRNKMSQHTYEERKNFTTRVEEAKAIINSQLVLLSGIIPGLLNCSWLIK